MLVLDSSGFTQSTQESGILNYLTCIVRLRDMMESILTRFGDVLRSLSEGVFGNEMNLASKLGEDLAGNGEILLTESAYQEISDENRRDIIPDAGV